MHTTDFSWAAGVYDGEGSASTYLPKRRKSRVRQMAVYQAGEEGIPPLLERFQAVVGGLGLIHGPSRGTLYQWHSKRHAVIDDVSERLWPWLSEAKRGQLRQAAREVGRSAPGPVSPSWSRDELVAWAAGFFDGEGSIYLTGDPRSPAVAMELPQASLGEIPDTLARFQRAVGAGVISGPRMLPSPWTRLPQYRWKLRRSADIERVVELLRPYSDAVKLRQMDACIQRARSSRGHRGA